MDENVKREAYMKGLQLKNTGLDEEAIYARLEKQGFPEELAKEVAKNVLIQRKTDTVNKATLPNPFGSKIAFIASQIKDWFD